MWSTILRNALSLFKFRQFGTGPDALRFLDLDLNVPFDERTAAKTANGMAALSNFRFALAINAIPIFLHLFCFPLVLAYVLYNFTTASELSEEAKEEFFEVSFERNAPEQQLYRGKNSKLTYETHI